MADNYLENKMADYMAGKNHIGTRRSPSGSRRGFIDIKFPPRRVLIAGDMTQSMTAAATAFVNAGCRVALLGADADGARCFPHDTDLSNAVERLFHDWHEIDVLIIAGYAPGVAEAVELARQSLPAPLRSEAARTIFISDNPDFKASTSTNTIILTDPSTLTDTAARICIYLCAPGAERITDARIVLS